MRNADSSKVPGPSKKLFGLKGKAPAPAPRQARVRPRLAVTVLGVDPSRVPTTDPLLADLPAGLPALPVPPAATKRPNLAWPSKNAAKPGEEAATPLADLIWPSHVQNGESEGSQVSLSDLVWSPPVDDAPATAESTSETAEDSTPERSLIVVRSPKNARATASEAPQEPADDSEQMAAPAASTRGKEPAEAPASQTPTTSRARARRTHPSKDPASEVGLDLSWPPAAEPAGEAATPARKPAAPRARGRIRSTASAAAREIDAALATPDAHQEPNAPEAPELPVVAETHQIDATSVTQHEPTEPHASSAPESAVDAATDVVPVPQDEPADPQSPNAAPTSDLSADNPEAREVHTTRDEPTAPHIKETPPTPEPTVSTPEATTEPDVSTIEAPTPEAPTPEAHTPEAHTPAIPAPPRRRRARRTTQAVQAESGTPAAPTKPVDVTPAEPVSAIAEQIEMPVAPPADMPVPEAVPTATGAIDAPGWPTLGELAAAAPAAREETSGDGDDPGGDAPDAFRPYKAVYERHVFRAAQQAREVESAETAAEHNAGATWQGAADDTDVSPEEWRGDDASLDALLDAAEAELQRIANRTGEDGDLRDARRREIDRAVREALGDDELSTHFHLLVGNGRFGFQRRGPGYSSEPATHPTVASRPQRSNEHLTEMERLMEIARRLLGDYADDAR